jgi:hypothetical protein
MYTCRPVCTPADLSVRLPTSLYVCRPVCTPVDLSVSLPTSLYVCRPVCTPVPVDLSVRLSTCLYISLTASVSRCLHVLHCKETIPKIRNKYSLKRNLHGLSPNFHIHVSVSDLLIPTIGLPILFLFIRKSIYTLR